MNSDWIHYTTSISFPGIYQPFENKATKNKVCVYLTITPNNMYVKQIRSLHYATRMEQLPFGLHFHKVDQHEGRTG